MSIHHTQQPSCQDAGSNFLLAGASSDPRPPQQGALCAPTSSLTDMVILDVHDELRQRVEVKPAAGKPTSVGEEGNGRHPGHDGRRCI